MRPASLTVALLLAAAAPAAAQQIRGQVVDSTGTPLRGETVMLHNVTATSGSLLDQTVTDSAGTFSFGAPTGAPEGSVYFAAVRRNGELFIGEMLRAPLTGTVEYRIEVGPAGRVPELGPASGALTTAPATPPPGGGDGTAWLLAIPVVAAAGFGAWLLLRPKGPAVRRRLLRDIAELDEQHAASPGADAQYRAQRAELFDQLRHETR